MLKKGLRTKIALMALILGVLVTGAITQIDHSLLNASAQSQAQTAVIEGTVKDETGFVVGQSIGFQITINQASDAACDDGSWTLEYGDGTSTQGTSSASRTHRYLRAGTFNAVLSYTYFEDVGVGAPDCQARTAGDSVPVQVRPLDPLTLNFSITPIVVQIFTNTELTFDASSSTTDETCTITQTNWDFGDENVAIGSIVNHTYASSGDFNVQVMISDSCGRSESGQQMLNVERVPLQGPIDFIGAVDSNWFNPENWAGGRVPGAGDSVQIGGDQTVIIDPSLDPQTTTGGVSTILFGPEEADIVGNATLEILPGTIFKVGNLRINDNAQLIARSAVIEADTITSEPEEPCTCFNPEDCGRGLLMNPSNLLMDEIGGIHGIVMNLGGNDPAAAPSDDDGVADIITSAGPGFYATIDAQTASLDNGCLELDLIYDFMPEPGDTFDIITASDTLTGRFQGLEDGDEVARFGDIVLVIHYLPNVVRIEAREPQPLNFVGASNDWFDPENWSTGRVPTDGDIVIIEGDSHVQYRPIEEHIGDNDGDGDTDRADSSSPKLQLAVCKGNAVLEMLPGSELQFEELRVEENASLFTRSSILKGTRVNYAGGRGCTKWECGYNPTYVEVEEFEFTGEGLALYLGGTTQASADGVGPGHYSFINTRTVTLNEASLQINTIYDFEPSAGDEFVIFQASESITGTFANYADGDVVLSANGVDLVISYTTNEIVLTAEESQN